MAGIVRSSLSAERQAQKHHGELRRLAISAVVFLAAIAFIELLQLLLMLRVIH